jgi:hypothetical protein
MDKIIGWLVYLVILILPNMIIIGAATVAAIFVYKVTKGIVPKPITILLAVIIPALMAFYIYRGYYPADEFYLGEYRAITLDTSIANIKVVYGSATYPTFHPDYCSTAILKFEKKKYDSAIAIVRNNPEFKDTMLIGSEAYNDVEKYYEKRPLYLNKFSRKDQSNHYFIGFMESNQALINRCYD